MSGVDWRMGLVDWEGEREALREGLREGGIEGGREGKKEGEKEKTCIAHSTEEPIKTAVHSKKVLLCEVVPFLISYILYTHNYSELNRILIRQ